MVLHIAEGDGHGHFVVDQDFGVDFAYVHCFVLQI